MFVLFWCNIIIIHVDIYLFLVNARTLICCIIMGVPIGLRVASILFSKQ